MRGATLVSEPGATFNYCNDNYNVLAFVVERVSKLPFAEFLRTRLFDPLNLRDTRFYLTTRDQMAGVSVGQLLVCGVPLAQRMRAEFLAGGGGIVSTATDLARWLMFQNTRRRTAADDALLSAASLATMHTPAVAGSRYGFGWERETLRDGTTVIEHSGKAPPYVAHQQLLPDGYAYAIVLNASHSFNAEAASFVTGMHELVAGRTPTVGPPFAFFGVSFGALADHTLALMTVLSLTIGVVGSMRASAWAARRRNRRTTLTIMRCLPYAALALIPAVFPWLLSVINRGAPVPWDVILSVWPPLPIFVVVSSVAGAAVAGARAICLWQWHRGSARGVASTREATSSGL
jgi:hypothetical protein